jgi:hypothetical protein
LRCEAHNTKQLIRLRILSGGGTIGSHDAQLTPDDHLRSQPETHQCAGGNYGRPSNACCAPPCFRVVVQLNDTWRRRLDYRATHSRINTSDPRKKATNSHQNVLTRSLRLPTRSGARSRRSSPLHRWPVRQKYRSMSFWFISITLESQSGKPASAQAAWGEIASRRSTVNAAHDAAISSATASGPAARTAI